MGTIRFGIIGAGVIAHFHAKAIQDAEGASLISIYNPSEEKRDSFAKEYGIRGYGDLAAFLADPELNAVTIATPTGAHLDVALPAARAKKHILCEKPLDINPERAQAIIDACRENGVVLAPIFQYRYGKGALLIKEALEAGRFGEVLLLSAKVKWFRPQSYYDSGAWRGTWDLDGGGCLMNQGVHAIDLLVYFGGIPIDVYGHTALRTHSGIEVEDTASGTVKFASGAFGVIEASTACAPGWPMEIEVSGSRGTATLTAESISTWDFCDDDPLDEKAQILMQTPATSSGASDPKAISTEGHRILIENMVRAIRGDSLQVIDGREARRSLDLICAFYESARTGEPVRLPDA